MRKGHMAFDKKNAKRTLIIACEVVARELYALAARSQRVVDIVLLPKGLHDLDTGKMRARLQEEIDKADPNRYDAVVMAYGLCNNGTIDLAARDLPLVIPRVHDCISFFFGSPERYREYFDANPGTYYETTGWTERGTSDLADGVMSQLGLSSTYAEYVEKYGKENADYIMSVLGGWKTNYKGLAYIRMPVEGLPEYTETARAEAAENNWRFELVDGDMSLLEALMAGGWDEKRFCVVPPGGRLAPTSDERIFNTPRGEKAS
jgi:hypothetical protein